MIEIPKSCPSCNSSLERIKDQLFCRNPDCTSTNIKKLTKFAKSMGIIGLGEKSIIKLDIDNIIDLYLLTEEAIIKKLGNKIGEKIYKEIINSKNTTIETLLGSLSVRLIGKTIAKKIKIRELNELTEEYIKKLSIGDKAKNNLLDFISSELYNNIMEMGFEFKEMNEGKIIVCITGKLNTFRTKGEAKEYLEDLGITVVDSISKKVDFLLNESGKESSKTAKAKQYNITILTDIKEIKKYV